jgi:hypothetical protein
MAKSLAHRLMDGFPPSPEHQVTLANWRTSPFNRWAFHHVRELIPSADISNDPAVVLPLPSGQVGLKTLAIGHARWARSLRLAEH